MRRAAGIALCLLAGCGLFPELEYLSTCQEGCVGTAGATGGSGAAGTTTAGRAGAAGGAGTSGKAGNGGTAGAPVVAGTGGTAGASGGGSAGAAGAAGNGASAGGGASAGTSGAGGSVIAGAAGNGGNAGATSGSGGAGGGSAGKAGAAGTGGAAGSTAGNGAGGSGGAAGNVTAGTGGSAGGPVGGSAGAGGGVVACPSGKGPSMVRLPKIMGGGCVDSTEVTFAQYDVFLNDVDVDPTDQPAECALNTTATAFKPTQYIYKAYTDAPSTYGSYAVSGVDWCDARAFCAWSGKKLCGKVGGGALPPAQRSSATDAWWLACATQAGKTYPYGGVYDAALCHTEDKGTELIRQGPSMASCVGGVPGLYDMSGNILEWTDSCATAATGSPAKDACSLRGGSYNYDASSVKCTYSQTADRVRTEQTGINDENGLYYTVFGFRCCSE